MLATAASVAIASAEEGTKPTETSETALQLSPLPKAPSLELKAPEPVALAAIDALIAKLTHRDPGEREAGLAEVLEIEGDKLPAIHRRLTTIAESSDHEAMRDVLSGVRDKGRDDAKKKKQAEGSHEKVETPDYLEMLVKHARPDSRAWKDLVAVTAMNRMLRHIDSTAAARELISIYARFGEFLRVDVQLGLAKMGDHAVAALIEAERHPAPKIAQWASRQLDALGKAIPSEAIQTQDPEALGDVLRALGRSRDPDAARLVISFCNSERLQIRKASREAVVLMGEVANWQLRDTYENVVGRKPAREWGWDRTAKELFAQFDKLRLSRVYVLFEEGKAREQQSQFDEMAKRWDEVLVQSPQFDRGPEMARGYLNYAKSHLDDGDPTAARSALRKVTRLSKDAEPDLAKAAESLLLTLDAEALAKKQIADQTLVRRALELDPQNSRAKKHLSRLLGSSATESSPGTRYTAAAAIGGSAVIGILLLLFRRRSASSAPEGADAPDASETSEDTAVAVPAGGAAQPADVPPPDEESTE